MSRGYTQFLEEHWEKLHGNEAPSRLRPFFAVGDKDDDTQILQWTANTLEVLEREAEPRAANMLNNIRFYNAIQNLDNSKTAWVTESDRQPLSKRAKIVLNFVREVTHKKEARLLRFSPTINAIPLDSHYEDRMAARLGKRVVDDTFFRFDIEALFGMMAKYTLLCGEGYIFEEWDPLAGPKSVDAERAKELQKTGLVQSFTNKDGEKVELDSVAKIGDFKFSVPLPWTVLKELTPQYADCNYGFKINIKHIDEVRAENPGMNVQPQKLAADPAKSFAYGPGHEYGEWVFEREFYHRHHKFLPEGRYIKSIEGNVLKNDDLPYGHGKLPWVRMTDIDSPIGPHGISFLEDIKIPQVALNNMATMAYRNTAMVCHPKIRYEDGSCDIKSFANMPSTLAFTPGATPPEIITFKGAGGEIFQILDRFEDQMQKLGNNFPMSRGEPLTNARAKSILSFYAEQEELNEAPQIKKYTRTIEQLGNLTISNASEFFDERDDRTLSVVGKNNQHKFIKVVKPETLRRKPKVKVERTTALSESKSGRIEQIVQLQQLPMADGTPGAIFTREQILKMIEVADTPAFFDMATAAVDKAQSENEDMFEGRDVPAPTTFEMLLVHWHEHFMFMQSREFTDTREIPEEVRTKFKNHLLATEVLMYDLAKKSAKFTEILAQIPYYPCLFKYSQGGMGLPPDPTIAQLLMLHMQPPGMAPPPGGSEAPPPSGPPGDSMTPDEAPQGDRQAADPLPPGDESPPPV